MVTTIQLSDETKRKLDQLKKKQGVSYDKIVTQLIQSQQKLTLREQAKEYYATYAKEDLDEVKEFKDEAW